MERENKLGMVVGYYLSRFNEVAYESLGFGSKRTTHEMLGQVLGVPAASIQNWRDEFDPIHDNERKGWHKREMYPSRRRVVEALGDLSHGELLSVVQGILDSPFGPNATEVLKAIEAADTNADVAYGLRGPTGVKAEEEFMRFHQKYAQPVPGTLIDRRLDQCGFDFEIESSSTSVFVEIKGLAGELGGITFTEREWSTAKEKRDAYYLALVRNVASRPYVKLFQNPAELFDAQSRTYSIVQVGWPIGQRALKAAEGRISG